MQAGLWGVAAGSAAVVLVAAVGERRRTKRRDLDRVGWVPWTEILLAALFAGLIAAALALKS
ncbi:hypothetical protein ABC347_05425 [Sphingomonas sp. 1P06PA]|uniref:hypothetical protein n=1 Tax=Sphingomonas sp. 1P06PA TaxID=554121 RepID=UPI0039A48B47